MAARQAAQIIDDEEAEEVAIEVLLWMGNKLDIMGRFLKMSGIPADDIRGLIGHRRFYVGLLGFVLNHEPDLMAFCEERSVGVEWVVLSYEHFAEEKLPRN